MTKSVVSSSANLVRSFHTTRLSSSLLIFHVLRSLGESLDLEALGGPQESGQLVLSNIDLSSVHELEDGSEMVEGHVFEDDDRVLGRVFLQQSLEVRRAGRQDHLVRLATLTVARNGHVSERLLIPEMLEGSNHVGLEVIPAQAKLLLVIHL